MSNKLQRRDFLILFALGLVLALGVSLVQRVPGYTDAEYYYSGGVRLFEGEGFTEMILWNYLDDPAGLPHPSHAYWMPLPSIVAAAGMVLFQSRSFFTGRFFFILISALIPPLTALLAQELGQNRRGAYLAGLLGLFSGFYVVYTTLTEGFSLVMVLGCVFFLAVFRKPAHESGQQTKAFFFLISGAAAGLIHLTRADGFLWLAAGMIAVGLLYFKQKTPLTKILVILTCMLGGYLLVMGPWFVRNLQAFGSLMAPGGTRSFWLRNYNEIFTYPAEQINSTAWLSSGWEAILKDRLGALWMNLQTALAVQGSVFQFPLMLSGLWVLHRDRRVQLGAGLWLAILGVMSVIFPYAGARGGFLHSGAALQPLLWASVPFGLDAIVGWASRKRSNWDAEMAGRVFGFGLVLFSLFVTAGMFSLRVVKGSLQNPVWQNTWDRQFTYADFLDNQGAEAEDIVMINNPAGLFAATGRAAIVIPDGEPDTAWLAATQYGAKFLILEKDHVDGLDVVYEDPEKGWPGMRYLCAIDNAYLFEFYGDK